VLRELPARSAIIDGEIVASDAAGMPDFCPLFLRSAKPAELHVWAFDLLALNRKDPRKWSLEARQERLQALVSRFSCPVLLHSEAFDDGQALLSVAEKHGLEGVVSKRRSAPYKSGRCRHWSKIKTAAWREANRERWRLFEVPGREGLGDVGDSGEIRAGATQTATRKGDDHVRLKRIASVEAGVLDAHVTSERR
jgi:hypothetical protein